jgi:hypothetical protein
MKRSGKSERSVQPQLRQESSHEADLEKHSWLLVGKEEVPPSVQDET